MSTTDTTVMRSSDLLNTFGVNTHIPCTDGKYADLGRVSQDLAYLGITNVRDNVTNGEYGSATLDKYIALAKQGVRFDFVVENSDDTPAKIDARLKLSSAVEAAVPGSVRTIEGWNEVNNFGGSFNGQTGEAGAEAAQAYIYSKVKADPILSAAGVIYFTGYDPGSTDPSKTPGLADYDNQHPYPNGQAPAFSQLPSTALVNETSPAKGTFEFTEDGYSTAPGGVTDREKATNTLDMFLDATKNGSAATYDYELLDAYPKGTPNGNSLLGLFDYDNTPTQAATAIHNLTSLLKDDGSDAATFATKAVGYSLSGGTPSTNSLEVQKSNGTTDIAVWAETPTGTTAATTPTTVTLDGKYDATVYDPLAGTTSVATYSDVSSLVLGITDHPLIVEVTPTAGVSTTPPATGSGDGGGTVTTPPVTTPPVSTNPGTGGTTPTGGSDGGSTVPPVTSNPGGSIPPVTTGGDAGTGTAPPVQSTDPMVPPVTTTSPGLDIGALTASITKSVTATVTALFQAKEDAAHAHAADVHTHNQDVAKAGLETYINAHSKVIRGDLLASAIVDALPQGGYRAERQLLQAMNPSGQAETGAWFEHALGTGGKPMESFLGEIEDLRQSHRGAAA